MGTVLAAEEKHFYRTHTAIRDVVKSTFINRTPLFSVSGRPVMIPDLVAAAVQSKTNMYFLGTRGTGKTLLAESIQNGVFGGKGFYIRGDINLQVKDLYQRFGIDASAGVVQALDSEAIGYKAVILDELNRVPGLLQNQFLHMIDGYVEIRGRKYRLGDGEYILTVATGNPPENDGEDSGVFLENAALLDRISLIINTDEIPLGRGDVYKISRLGVEKGNLRTSDLTDDVVTSYKYLMGELDKSGEEHPYLLALLAEFIYRQFRFVSVGRPERTLDKTTEAAWRDIVKGEHASGVLIPYCSEISVRTLQNIRKLAFALSKIFDIGHKAVSENKDEGIHIRDFVNAYIAALKFALTYDRRFIPRDLPGTLNGNTHAQMLDTVFDTELRGKIDDESLLRGALLLMEFEVAKSKRRDELIISAEGLSNVEIGRTVTDIMRGMKTDDLRITDEKRLAGIIEAGW